jgi:ribosome-binding protein aMBF1 (putative translation factor)
MIQRNGKRYVLVEPGELRRLEKLAAAAHDEELLALPPADADGNRPAVEYARISIARKIIEQRRALGLSQQELSALAGMRQETISRLESGKHSPTIRTVDKIDAALRRAQQRHDRSVKRKSSSRKN